MEIGNFIKYGIFSLIVIFAHGLPHSGKFSSKASKTKKNFSDSSELMTRPKLFCKHLASTHHVVPGQSWGSMSLDQQQLWMASFCDSFFCEANKLAGKGIYKCIPLNQEEPETNLP